MNVTLFFYKYHKQIIHNFIKMKGAKMGYENFINKNSCVKTLVNELRPTEWTRKHIEEDGILSADELRAEESDKLKSIMDDYYRRYIYTKLFGVSSLDWDELFSIMEVAYKSGKKDKNCKAQLEKVQEEMRGKFYNVLSDDDIFKMMFSGKFVTKVLPEFVRNNKEYSAEEKQQKLDTLKLFKGFTTSLVPFFNNRENIFSKKPIHSSICHRTVDENTAIFYQNIISYKNIEDNAPQEIEKIEHQGRQQLDEWKLPDIYSYSFYNNVLTQHGIEFYNDICGIVNSHMNLYCQQTKEKSGQYRMRKLYKQILSISSTSYEVPYKYEDDAQVYSSINEFVDRIFNSNFSAKVEKMLEKAEEYDFDKIYIASKNYSSISNFISGKWNTLEDCIRRYYEDNTVGNGDKKEKKVEEKVKKDSFRSLDSIDKVVEMYEKGGKSAKEYIYQIREIYSDNKLYKFGQDGSDSVKLIENDAKIERIKCVLDMLLNTNRFLDTFTVEDGEAVDVGFYSEIDELKEIIDGIDPLYNRVRNYVTRKPYNKNKIKLNFNSPTLAEGWSKSKEYEDNAIILRRDGKYYLGIFNVKNKPDKKIMEGYSGDVGDGYEKMVYSLLPGAGKMLPKVFLSKKGIGNYKPSSYIIDGYDNDRHIKSSKNFDINFCHDLIDYFKSSISANPDWKVFDFKFSDTKSYEDISGFYSEVEKQGYKISWVNISKEDIDRLDETGQIYLFQIYNKDFSESSMGTPNLHTLYFKNLFSEENIRETVLKLSGKGELFFRKASIDKPSGHRKGSILVNKTYKTNIGNEEVRVPIPDKEYMEIYTYLNNGRTTKLSENAQSLLDNKLVEYFEAEKEIVKDRRYTVDKFFIHTSVVINYNAEGASAKQLNEQVLDYISKQDDMHIIGIDRGERNLVYVSVIDMKGRIVEQKSYNVVNSYSYQKKLVEREKARDEARKSWKEVGRIKDLKDGYLSLVVHEIADMVIKYNAIIAMEDLNYGFKRGRFKIERQVYQKFESMLISKLSYLVDKTKKADEPGGVLKGYQLAFVPKDVKKVGRQCGIIFYVPPAYTSKIDPATGFVDLFKFKSGEKEGTARADNDRKEFLSKFDDIRYVEKNDNREEMFAFTFDYDNFAMHNTVIAKKKWTAYTFGSRIQKVYENGRYTSNTREIELSDKMKRLLNENNIEYGDGHNLVDDIRTLDVDSSGAVINEIFKIFRLTVQLRNSKSEAENEKNGEYDRIISPIMNDAGEFFDSFKYKKMNEETEPGKHNATMPIDADANGAYCIAMKCLYEAKNIKSGWEKEGKKNNDLLCVTNADWFDFMQNKRYV